MLDLLELDVHDVEGLRGCYEEKSSPLKEQYLLLILSHLSSPDFPILYIRALIKPKAHKEIQGEHPGISSCRKVHQHAPTQKVKKEPHHPGLCVPCSENQKLFLEH